MLHKSEHFKYELLLSKFITEYLLELFRAERVSDTCGQHNMAMIRVYLDWIVIDHHLFNHARELVPENVYWFHHQLTQFNRVVEGHEEGILCQGMDVLTANYKWRWGFLHGVLDHFISNLEGAEPFSTDWHLGIMHKGNEWAVVLHLEKFGGLEDRELSQFKEYHRVKHVDEKALFYVFAIFFLVHLEALHFILLLLIKNCKIEVILVKNFDPCQVNLFQSIYPILLQSLCP